MTPIVSRWFGLDQPTRIVVVAIMTFAPMVISAYKGLTALNNESLDLLYSYAAGPWDTFRKLRAYLLFAVVLVTTQFPRRERRQ